MYIICIRVSVKRREKTSFHILKLITKPHLINQNHKPNNSNQKQLPKKQIKTTTSITKFFCCRYSRCCLEKVNRSTTSLQNHLPTSTWSSTCDDEADDADALNTSPLFHGPTNNTSPQPTSPTTCKQVTDALGSIYHTVEPPFNAMKLVIVITRTINPFP